MGVTKQWNSELYQLGSYSPQQVQKYCVQDAEWQKFRLSLKGQSTTDKLDRLVAYWRVNMNGASAEREIRIRCQVTNYLYALKRGGQLGENLEAKK